MSNEDKLNQIFDEINSIGFKGSNEFELHLKEELLKWMNEVSNPSEPMYMCELVNDVLNKHNLNVVTPSYLKNGCICFELETGTYVINPDIFITHRDFDDFTWMCSYLSSLIRAEIESRTNNKQTK